MSLPQLQAHPSWLHMRSTNCVLHFCRDSNENAQYSIYQSAECSELQVKSKGTLLGTKK